ncbi:FMN-dependent NADH-azoreductase [Paracidovorax citrulli]
MKPIELLLLECSPRRDQSTSRLLGRQLVNGLKDRLHSEVRLARREIGVEPLPPISADYADSLLLPLAQARSRYGASLAVSDELIAELVAADLLVISTPVHNFTVPAALKTWIDYVVRRDVTFQASPEGKVGLLRDRPTLVAVTAGGAMFRDPPIQPDFFRPYLQAALGVIGIHSVTFAQAPGLAFSDTPLAAVNAVATDWLERNAHALAALHRQAELA